MNKQNNKVICALCYSKNLYKFGKDREDNQKFQCKDCGRQFVPAKIKRELVGYPKCPRCGKGTYLHHDHKHYTRFKLNVIIKMICHQ